MGIPRLLAWTGQAVLLLLVVGANNHLCSKLEGWHRDGWSGYDALEVQALDRIAREVRSEGKHQTAIGYEIFFEGPNPRYQLGSDFNLLLKYRHALSNSNQCPEGISMDDEYRIVQPTPGGHNSYVTCPPRSGDFHLIGAFGDYQVLRRKKVEP
jgi:hypothetical protein